MRICGLITEYNPFHNGHIHHIKEARRLTGCDYLVVVMSGDYVQRGTPAILDKYDRTRMAINGGADLVLELPTLFATSSAEIFAEAAVALLHSLGCVDTLCFGSECGNLKALETIAEVLNHEPAEVSNDIKAAVKSGLSYPKARELALQNYLKQSVADLQGILEKPNNILGIEYIRALKKLNSKIEPLAIKRWHTDYHSEMVYEDVASATALRTMLYGDCAIEMITPYVSPYVAREFALKLNVSTPVRSDDLSLLLQHTLLRDMNRLEDYLDFTVELKERVKNILPDCYNFQEWANMLKTKTYTHTRINRALLHAVLNMKTSDLEDYRDVNYCMYARVLGFKREAREVLTAIKKNGSVPMITKVANARKILDEKGNRLLWMDIFGADIYRSIVYRKFGTPLPDEFTTGVIILDEKDLEKPINYVN